MKVNEIVQEGFWDTIKTGIDTVKGAAAGYKTGGLTGAVRSGKAEYAASPGRQQAEKQKNDLGQQVLQAWSAYVPKLRPDQIDTPVKYKAEVDSWLKRRNRDPAFKVTGATLPATGTISNTDLISYFEAAEMQRTSAPPKEKTVGRYPLPAAAASVEINGETYSFDPGTKQWTASSGEVIAEPNEIAQLNQEAHKKSSAPVKSTWDNAKEILTYRGGKTYRRNHSGQWFQCDPAGIVVPGATTYTARTPQAKALEAEMNNELGGTL